MDRSQTGRFLLWASFVLIALFLAVAQFGGTTQSQIRDSALALAIIAATAIGIERVIEAVWTGVGLIAGSWWPLKQIGERIGNMTSDLDEILTPYYEQAKIAADNAMRTAQWTEEQINAAKTEIEALKTKTRGIKEELMTLAPDRQRVHSLAAAAVGAVSTIEKRIPGLQSDAVVALQAITGITDFVATFKDNPGRRLISIYLGSFFGLVVAGLLGLDVFQAVLESEPGQNDNATMRFFPYLGVAVTGLIIGLGSSPTHEVIRALQEYKKSRKAANDPTPVVPDGSSDEPSVSLTMLSRAGGFAATGTRALELQTNQQADEARPSIELDIAPRKRSRGLNRFTSPR